MNLRRILLNGVSAVLLTLTCASLSCSAGEKLPQLVVTRVSTAPVIDGKLNDSAWAKAKEVGGFHVIGTTSAVPVTPTFPTYVKAVTDGKALYLGLRCIEPKAADLKTVVEKRDGEVWLQESVEVVIDGKGDGSDSYHLITNVSGGQYDTRITTFMTGAYKEDDKWNGDWDAKGSKGDKEWYSEIKIPFSTIGADLNKSSVFRVSLCRTKWIDKNEISAWSPNRLRFVELTNMAELILPKADGSFCQVKFPRLATTEIGAHKIPFSVLNHSDKAIKPRLTYVVTGLDRYTGSVQLKAVAPGKELAAALPLNIKTPGEYNLHVILTDAVSKKVLYSLIRKVDVTQPISFDEALYAMYQKRADATLTVCVPAAGAKLRVSLLKEGSKTPVASKVINSPLMNPIKVSFNLTGMTKGTYVMRAELVKGGKSFGASHSRNFPYTPNPKIGFNKDGYMILDGKTFFAMGIYSLRSLDKNANDDFMKDAKQAGFNSTVLYDDDWKNLKPLLDRCQRNGIKAFVYPTVPFSVRKGEVTPDDVRRDLDLKRNHPAIIGWYIVDEPEGIGLAPVAPVRDLYQIIKEHDLDHPCTLVIMSDGAAKDYREATDIMWTDPYPVPKLPVTLVSETVAGSVRNIEKDKPLWCVPQAFDWNVWNEGKLIGEHRPTAVEERCMTYLALVNGAKGIIYWPYVSSKYNIYDYPEHWMAIKKIASEVRDLTPTLITPTISGKLSVAPKNDAIQTMVKKVNGQWNVMTVNSSTNPCDANFTLPGVADGAKVEVLFEGRSISVENGGWKDSFKPMEVHVYRVSTR